MVAGTSQRALSRRVIGGSLSRARTIGAQLCRLACFITPLTRARQSHCRQACPCAAAFSCCPQATPSTRSTTSCLPPAPALRGASSRAMELPLCMNPIGSRLISNEDGVLREHWNSSGSHWPRVAWEPSLCRRNMYLQGHCIRLAISGSDTKHSISDHPCDGSRTLCIHSTETQPSSLNLQCGSSVQHELQASSSA